MRFPAAGMLMTRLKEQEGGKTHGRMVNRVIVIPKSSRILAVWVVIVFVLSRFRSIISPAVEWGTSFQSWISDPRYASEIGKGHLQ